MKSGKNKQLQELESITLGLSEELGSASAWNQAGLTVYNPLEYALKPQKIYLERFGGGPKEVVLVGMNPGPWGMVQTGIPFGDVAMVRDWLGILAPVGKPALEHPRRPVEGFACVRSEGSGRRLWGWAKKRFDIPERFFKRFFVVNYCPLAFFKGPDGVNITPDKLPINVRNRLFLLCDEHLRRFVLVLQPEWVLGLGNFAAERVRIALDGEKIRTGRLIHPSPASPAANRGWVEAVEREMGRMGIRLD